MALEPAPSGRRSLPNRTPDEALDGIQEINSRYLSHCASAREIAETYFESGEVLTRLLTAVHRKPAAKNA
jgi:hypothetical protein